MRKLAVAAVVVILATAIVLTLPLLREGFWCDEALSIAIARDSFPGQFFHDLSVAESSPPLFNLALAGWGRAFGWDEMPVKLYALSWGLLSVAGICAAAWQLAGPAAGVLAAALALHSPLVTSHIPETRSYAMSVALLTFGIAALWNGIESDRRALRRIAIALLAGACWSHYVAFVSVAGCCGMSSIVAYVTRKIEWRRIAVVNAIAAASIAPLLPILAPQLHAGIPHEPARSLTSRLLLAGHKFAFALPRSNFAPPLAGAIVFIIAAVAPLFFLRALPDSARQHGRAFAFAAFYAIPVFAVFGPLGSAERYVVLGAAMVCVICAILIVAIARAAAQTPPSLVFRVAVASYFILSIGNVLRQTPQIAATSPWPKSGARPLAETFKFDKDDVILAAPEVLAETVSYYAPRTTVVGFTIWDRPQVPDVAQQRALWSNSGAVVPETVARLNALIRTRRPSRVFFLSGRIGAGEPLYLDPRIRLLMTALQNAPGMTRVAAFDGRVESVVLWQIGRMIASAPSPAHR